MLGRRPAEQGCHGPAALAYEASVTAYHLWIRQEWPQGVGRSGKSRPEQGQSNAFSRTTTPSHRHKRDDGRDPDNRTEQATQQHQHHEDRTSVAGVGRVMTWSRREDVSKHDGQDPRAQCHRTEGQSGSSRPTGPFGHWLQFCKASVMVELRQRPNESRLSCGRNARRRKALEPQKQWLAGEATQFFPHERPTASSAC